MIALEPLLFQVACRLCRRTDDAHDLVQDTFERALRRGVSPNPNLKAWLLSILHHRFIDVWRKRGKREVTPAPDAPLAAPEAEAEAEPRWAALDEERVRAAVERLQPEQREVFLLHALEGRAYVEVARRIGIPQSTVGTRLFRARLRLRRLLEQELWRAGIAGEQALARRRAGRAALARCG